MVPARISSGTPWCDIGLMRRPIAAPAERFGAIRAMTVRRRVSLLQRGLVLVYEARGSVRHDRHGRGERPVVVARLPVREAQMRTALDHDLPQPLALAGR